jgi:hypothetical protein
MHAGKGRRTDVPPKELAKILRRLKCEGQVDGVVVYSWADFLEQQFEQGLTQAIDAIKSCL